MTKHIPPMAFCVLLCDQCPVYIATKTGYDILKAKLAQDYSSGTCIFSPEDMHCTGCRAPTGANPKMCEPCFIRSCGLKRGMEHCGQCDDYPCQWIGQFVPADSDHRRRLDALHEIPFSK